MDSHNGSFHQTTASAPPRMMDGQLSLLKKKMRSRPSSRSDNAMYTLPAENLPVPSSASNRGMSAPPYQNMEAPDEPRSMTSTPSPQLTADRFAPKRVGRVEKSDGFPIKRSTSGSVSRRRSNCSTGSAQQPSSARQPSAMRHITCPVSSHSSSHSMPPPLPVTSESQVGRCADICGLSIPVFFLSRICGYVPVSGLPAFRRICSWFHRVVSKRLSVDTALRAALTSHLEKRRQQSKRVWVVVRARPWEDVSCISILDQNRVTVKGGNETEPYFFDRAFGGSATQEEVSNYVIGQILRYALNREHLCILAYGQTGSGKTHTMFGSLERGGMREQGVAFRALNTLAGLFRDKHTGPLPDIDLSFLEVYNDQLFDLLDKQRQLPRQRSSEKHNVPQGLTRKRCEISKMEEQVHSLLCEGAATRTVGKTVFNPRSSRSHAVVMLHIGWHDTSGRSRSAPQETRIYLVDLAGCERAGMYAISPEQRKEGENINLSLSALGRVVNALAGGKCEHVPYRDSALTWLLKDAITGTSARVCMVAALHPAHPVETASTLRYARQYSSLQTSSGTRMPQLAREARDLQRRVDSMKKELEKALAGEENLLNWNRETLKGNVHCQFASNAKELVEEHPYLSWTDSHQSKMTARGRGRGDRSGIGYISFRADVPPPRDAKEKPDGRLVKSDMRNGIACDKVVEITFEGKNGRPPVILWIPEHAVEMLQPPRPLVEALEKLQAAEAELGRKQAELHSAKKEEAVEQQEWMATSKATG